MGETDWRSQATWQHLRKRAELLQYVRQFFSQRGVIEVDTPLLAQAGVTDVHLDNLTTRLSVGVHGKPQKRYLQTSPEYAMKRLLAQFQQSIYQLSHVLRDDEVGRYHNPEFTLLEWYRVGFDHHQLIDEISSLLSATVGAKQVVKQSYQSLFLQHLGADPLTKDGVTQVAIKLRERPDTSDWMATETNPDTILQVAFNLLIEPHLDPQTPTAVMDFPASQAALAQLDADDPRVAHRFEIYYQGIELANGYNELTDAEQQAKRFAEDNQQRRQMDKPAQLVDERLLAALNHGLPQCAGVALGFDRLVMIATGVRHIAEILPFTNDNS